MPESARPLHTILDEIARRRARELDAARQRLRSRPRRVLKFFGRSMFFGIGGLVSGAFIVALDGGHVPMIEVVWLVVAAVWTLLGMLARTFAWR